MFNGFHSMPPSNGEIATQVLNDEGTYRFSSFSASDAITLVRILSDQISIPLTAFPRAFLSERDFERRPDTQRGKVW